MVAYASRTGTKRNLAALRAAGWRLMVSAKGRHRTEGFPYALDNGAWWAHQTGLPFDSVAFWEVYRRFGDGADFVVLPDIVGGGLRSLVFSLRWRARMEWRCPQLLAVQDGMTPALVATFVDVGPDLGIFVGGTTEWKERTLPAWGKLAKARGAYLHVGRVNTARRIELCALVGAHSFDGSSASRYVATLPLLDGARRKYGSPAQLRPPHEGAGGPDAQGD